VNGGLARSGRRRDERRRARRAKRRCESGCTFQTGARPTQDPGWRESVIQRSQHRQKRCGGRGTGAVMATGSCEGSLPMEGIPGHPEASALTRRRTCWPWRLAHPRPATPPRKRGARGARMRRHPEHGGQEREATGMSEARSHRHRGKTTPTPVNESREAEVMGNRVFDDDPPKRSWTV
jgi:hypothetical protein